jgi:hypothetical protein
MRRSCTIINKPNGNFSILYNKYTIAAMQIEGKAANDLEEEILNKMDPKDVQNIFLFNITADPYETTDLSQVSLTI